MGRRLGAGAVALVAMVATGTAAVAAPKCALPAELTAIQAAAVQQQLMVAALTCNAITNFNAFQTGYSAELRSSDRRLMSMFQRLFGGRKGTEEYHAFKTRLANDSSIRSIHDNADYCREAQLVFAAALSPEKPTLASFVSGVAVKEASPVDSCEIRVAGGLEGMKAIPNVVPKPNPMRMAALMPASVSGAQAIGSEPAPAAVQAQQAQNQEPAPAAGPQAQDPQQAPASDATKPEEAPKKRSGWLSGIFN